MLNKNLKTFSLIPFKYTMDTKLRWFQYKILNRILTTNAFMYKIGHRNYKMYFLHVTQGSRQLNT